MTQVRRKGGGKKASPEGGPEAEPRARATWGPAAVAALLALVLLAQVGVVAAAWIPAPHNGGDNAAYIALGHALLHGKGYTEVWDPATPPHTKYPPLFPLVLAFAMALGARTWTALKLVPAAATTLAVLLTFLWARRRRGPLFAAGVAGLFAVSSALVDASHWVLSDPLFVALTMLALWAFARVEAPGEADGSSPGGDGPLPSPRAAAAWLALGCVAAVAAYFTRSAGLPLLVAVAAWLALGRRWKALAGFAVGAGVPAALWWLRARSVSVAQGAYGNEFWLKDPYTPELGRVGVGGMLARVAQNMAGYVGSHVPGGIVGAGGGWVPVLGVILFALAVTGWVLRLRKGPGVAELFTPLYLGLILLWPTVWSGDRFALPLFPLLFLYAGEAVVTGARRLGRRGAPALAGGLALLLVGAPAVVGWVGATRQASACSAMVARGGPWACWGPRFGEIIEAARWSRAALPADAAVLTRKPRIFYLVSGRRSRTYPFTDDPGAFLAQADAAGARWVLLDFFGRQGAAYVAGSVGKRPGAFCAVRPFDLHAGGTLPSELLGILPPDARRADGAGPGARVAPCPPALRGTPGAEPPPVSDVVPLLEP